MSAQDRAPKRGLEFNTDFKIPKRKASDTEYKACLVLDNEESTTSEVRRTQVAPVKKKPIPFLAAAQQQEVSVTKDKDPTLPQELLIQFQPLFCKLCECQHTSNIMAKLHYNSKKHEKKVRKFLLEYAEKTGTTPHPRASAVKRNDPDPKNFYCETCGVPLSGKQHADSHYMSRNHRRVVLGKALPIGPERSEVDLRCHLCNVSVTSEQQMTLHVNGSRHKKKARLSEPQESVSGTNDTILSSLSESVAKTDLSVFRTPTGFYYCNPCDLTLNSEIQFKQHLDSKRHKKIQSV